MAPAVVQCRHVGTVEVTIDSETHDIIFDWGGNHVQDTLPKEVFDFVGNNQLLMKLNQCASAYDYAACCETEDDQEHLVKFVRGSFDERLRRLIETLPDAA
jgi:hypothetical protein